MQKNTVSHFELYATDPDKLADFYSRMFDWKVEAMPDMDYRVIRTGDTDPSGRLQQPGAINGGIARRPEGFTINGAVNYAMVDSIEDAVTRASSLGATLTRGKTPVPGMGWFAMLIDPQGNPFAMWQSDPNAK